VALLGKATFHTLKGGLADLLQGQANIDKAAAAGDQAAFEALVAKQEKKKADMKAHESAEAAKAGE
jgi:hypothetical protein